MHIWKVQFGARLREFATLTIYARLLAIYIRRILVCHIFFGELCYVVPFRGEYVTSLLICSRISVKLFYSIFAEYFVCLLLSSMVMPLR